MGARLYGARDERGSDAKVASCLECEINGQVLWGEGIDANTTTAALKVIISAVNRASH